MTEPLTVTVRTRVALVDDFDDPESAYRVSEWVQTQRFVDPVEDPDDTHEPDLATADPVPEDDAPNAPTPDPEGDD